VSGPQQAAHFTLKKKDLPCCQAGFFISKILTRHCCIKTGVSTDNNKIIGEHIMESIDCRGLACPAPVLKTKDLIDREGLNEFAIIVDNEAARQNVSRFLEFQGFDVSVEKDGANYNISARRKEETGCQSCCRETAVQERQKIMVMVTTDSLGHGDDELGSKLMGGFLKTLKEMGDDLWRIVFLNNGVKLTVEGSSALAPLNDLRDQGALILVCGTCLTHFNLIDKLQVGEITNMLDIITAMQVADKVINI
jgi:selenium metabolism protein YedF